MKYIAIVECTSSGILYVDEIISRGFKPLVVNIKAPSQDLINYRAMLRKNLEKKVEFIDEDEDYDTFVAKLRRYSIIAVFPGSESGVRLADRLVKSLGLVGNDEATTYLRCTKEGMYEALCKANLRRIETRKVETEEDIEEFWKENDLQKCVLKFSESAGTVGLRICSGLAEAVEHFKQMKITPDFLGKIGSEVLIQEFISGTEYIVDTISCDGKHMLTDVWEYRKITADDGTLAYDYVKLIKDLNPGHVDMIRYVYAVLDAVDMRWGICHCEVMIDNKGPILIETNARPIGLAMTSTYLDEILGYHLTDIAIDTYLDPSRFDMYAHRVYDPPKYALMKLMIVPEDIVGTFAPIFVLSNFISSTREVLFFGKEGVAEYGRTIDLETSPVTIKMANENYGDLMKDYEMLRLVESNYFHFFYEIDGEIPPVELRTDIKKILAFVDPRWRVLVVTDDGLSVAQNGQLTDFEGWMVFDGAIYACCGKSTTKERYRSLFTAIRAIRSGGGLIIIPESFEAIKSGSVIMEFMMNVSGVHVIAPSYDFEGLVCGLKK